MALENHKKKTLTAFVFLLFYLVVSLSFACAVVCFCNKCKKAETKFQWNVCTIQNRIKRFAERVVDRLETQ